jgi:uncharacterized protein (TIGR03382 family)
MAHLGASQGASERPWRRYPLRQSGRIDSAAAPPILLAAASRSGSGAVLALAVLIVGLLFHRRKEPARTLSRSSG